MTHMAETFPNSFINWVALLGGVFTIVQFVIIIIQINESRRTKTQLAVILSTIWRHGDAIKSRASSCRNAGASDKEALLYSIETSADSIRIEIEEFQRRNLKEELPSTSKVPS